MGTLSPKDRALPRAVLPPTPPAPPTRPVTADQPSSVPSSESTPLPAPVASPKLCVRAGEVEGRSASLSVAVTRPLPAAVTVGAVPVVLGAVGFTGAGITASSLAAKMMSVSAIANGGGVAAGGLVATLQSTGECPRWREGRGGLRGSSPGALGSVPVSPQVLPLGCVGSVAAAQELAGLLQPPRGLDPPLERWAG